VTSESVRWELVNPEGAARAVGLTPAPRPTSLEGKTVGLAWNGKPGGDVALESIAELLSQSDPSVRFIKYWQSHPESRSERELSAPVIDAMAAAKPDLVIVSQGD
jgi:ABC-type Fe3+-hydroxamate transport system substrate-binding protein